MRRRWIGHAIGAPSKIAEAVMTFQTQGEDYGPFQQTRVRGSVRAVAGLTPVDAHSGVFEYERTALVDMALQAGLYVAFHLFHHAGAGGHIPRRGRRAVGIVTVGALHESFVHPMLERHRKLGAHGGVTTVTKLGLLFCQ